MRTGTTTNQMKSSPPDAFYIWPNASLNYPRALARKIGRLDLKINPVSWLTRENLSGMQGVIVLDHAVNRLDINWKFWVYVKSARIEVQE